MQSRWFNVAVVLLWLTTMGWLVRTKVLPALLVGEPPSSQSVLEAQRREPPVGWDMSWNGKPLGWALNLIAPLPSDLTELRSRVHFDFLPLRDIIPAPLLPLVGSLDEESTRISTNVNSQLVYDPLGRLSRFMSALQFEGVPDAVTVRGAIDGPKLRLSIYTGNFNLDKELPIGSKTMLNDAMSPQTHLPGLRQGQTWSVQLYSPLHAPTEPLEVLQVEVERLETIVWDRHYYDTWVVVYRSDPGSGGRDAGTVRGRMWVTRKGTVLRQELTVVQSTLTFTRMSDERAAELAETRAADLQDDAKHLFGKSR